MKYGRAEGSALKVTYTVHFRFSFISNHFLLYIIISFNIYVDVADVGQYFTKSQ